MAIRWRSVIPAALLLCCLAAVACTGGEEPVPTKERLRETRKEREPGRQRDEPAPTAAVERMTTEVPEQTFYPTTPTRGPAAIAIRAVSDLLGTSQAQRYAADVSTIQAAVDAYFTSPGNLRFLGRRQYPIMGANKTSGLFIQPDKDDLPGTLSSPDNPLGGTQGGDPRWMDNGNGIRDSADEVLNDEDAATAVGWHVGKVIRQGNPYVVDSRDYFIDFSKLVADGLLEKAPDSASPDNQTPPPSPAGSFSGSYSWFVDRQGRVRSHLFYFPEPDMTGYQDVYP